jgi:hypothetical protein
VSYPDERAEPPVPVARTTPAGMPRVPAGYRATMVVGGRRRTRSIGSILVVVWLVIGVLAAAQRGYFAGGDATCASVSTIVVTVLAGPLNYIGVNPQIQCPELPQPSG